LRHGIAVDRADPDCPPDDLRPLTSRGVGRTERAARGLARLEIDPERIWTSPLARARQTAEIAREALGVPKRRVRETKALLPDAAAEQIIEDLRRARVDRVLLVGHAPNLDRILAHLVGVRTPFTALGKAGAAALDVRRLEAGGASLEWILPPKVLRRKA
jgi:phosphohistidine phosphatase